MNLDDLLDDEPGETGGNLPVDTGPADPAVEAEARQLGWIPQDEYTGDPAKWKPADKFLEIGRNNNRILNERLRTSMTRTQKLEAEIADLRKGVDEAREFFGNVEQRAYQKAREDLLAQKRAALQDNDPDGVIAADEALLQLQPPKPREAPKPADPAPAPAIDVEAAKAEFQTWMRTNNWFMHSEEARTDFQGLLTAEYQRNPQAAPRELFTKAAQRLRKLHPDLAPAGDPRQSLEGPGNGGGRATANRAARGYKDMPADARAAADRFVKLRLVKDVETYAKQYWLTTEN